MDRGAGLSAAYRLDADRKGDGNSGEATLLLMVVPAGFENCIRELRAEESRGDADGRTFVERMVTTNARYDTEITGPPPIPIAW